MSISRTVSKVFLALSGVVFISGLGHAQSSALPAQDKNAKLAQYYESQAAKTLSKYYEDGTYLIKAKVEFTLAPEAETGEAEDVAESPPDLPGLPFLPETMASNPNDGDKEKKKSEDGNWSIALDVLVDTSYSDKDLDFVNSLLTMAAHINEERGDKVTVHEGVFPRDNRSLQSYRKPAEPLPPVLQSAIAKADSNKNAESDGDANSKKTSQNEDQDSRPEENKKAETNPFGAYTEHLPSLIPLLLICLLILACVWMVSRAMASSPLRHNREIINTSVQTSTPEQPKSGPDVGKAALAKPQPNEVSAFRPYLLNCFVGSPKHCGQILKSWIQRDSEKGLRDSACLIGSLDGRLMSVLGPEIGKEIHQSLEVHLNSGDALPPEELMVVYKEFKREFQNLSNSNQSEDQYKDLFGFLRSMNEQQIMHILRDESQGIAGLVMAQLPGEVASSILQKVDPESRAKMLIAMGNIDHIPLSVYKELADRLSLKALDVGNMRFVAADGVDSILELIENLPLNLQFQYIHSVSEMDLGLGEKLRNRYVTLPEVVMLPDKFLSNIIQNLDQETLILSLAHADEALRQKFLSLLPERMQMMVSSGLESSKDVTPKDSESGQRRILTRIRDEIKHSGRPV